MRNLLYEIIINYKCSRSSNQDLTHLGLFEWSWTSIVGGQTLSGQAVVKNNDIDEGADITSDFDHLGCKFPFLTKKY